MRINKKPAIIEISLLAKGLRKLAISQLSRRQKKTLEIVSNNGFNSNATRLINALSEQLECSPSTVWNILRSLYKLGLIDCGTKEAKGRKLELTALGGFLAGEGGKNGEEV